VSCHGQLCRGGQPKEGQTAQARRRKGEICGSRADVSPLVVSGFEKDGSGLFSRDGHDCWPGFSRKGGRGAGGRVIAQNFGFCPNAFSSVGSSVPWSAVTPDSSVALESTGAGGSASDRR
jgi:hypothetical protein